MKYKSKAKGNVSVRDIRLAVGKKALLCRVMTVGLSS